jgi:putative transposase
VEITRHDPAPVRPESVVGVDLGIKSLAVLSTGEVIANPRHLEVAHRELRRLQRQAARRRARIGGPSSSPRAGGASPRHASRNSTRLSRTPAATACTNSRLVATHGTIVVETLHVAGMLRNKRLAGDIAGVGWGELRRQIEYKSQWAGSRVHQGDRWYPSSKTCSAWGVVKTKLRLSERTFRCDECGLVLDRDLKAARNLAGLVGQVVEVIGGTSSPSCGATVNEPEGNPHQTHTVWAAGYRRRPTPTGAGQRRRGNAPAQDTLLHVP